MAHQTEAEKKEIREANLAKFSAETKARNEGFKRQDAARRKAYQEMIEERMTS